GHRKPSASWRLWQPLLCAWPRIHQKLIRATTIQVNRYQHQRRSCSVFEVYERISICFSDLFFCHQWTGQECCQRDGNQQPCLDSHLDSLPVGYYRMVTEKWQSSIRAISRSHLGERMNHHFHTGLGRRLVEVFL